MPWSLDHYPASMGVRRGEPLPMGVRELEGGVNFSLFSRHATHVRLELFEQPGDEVPTRIVELDPVRNRTGDIWHVWVRGVRPSQLYGYRVDGPYRPCEGHRFNFAKLLIDPYATALAAPAQWDFDAARGYDASSPAADVASGSDDAAAMPKSVFIHEHFRWHEAKPPRHPWSGTVIYELHVRGFTVDPSSGVDHPGTYRGLAEKIPYLRDLGVTAVELMPVHEFNDMQVVGTDPLSGRALRNYWGYDPIAFLAPKASYSSARGIGQQVLEFKEMVRSFHRAGIEVILDVVFNHTAEGDEYGPTLSYRGIDNALFYMLEPDGRHYRNYSGCGNTLNGNHPVVREHILDALRHWMVEMHVDGFRFDLAAVMGRDVDGRMLANAPLLHQIAEDPILRDAKIIAEAWDEAGAYEVGSFADRRWAEWNARYRDDVRRFWRGDDGMRGLFASRLCGSSDLYAGSGKGPECSINFIASHDGFTLNDVVSYRRKHNEANGEGNRDGAEENFTDNLGAEGETGDDAIERLRRRQIRNFVLTLFVSRGIPMLLAGDEFRRTQGGNNNAYCQDNTTSWVDWTLLERDGSLHDFVRSMIAFRRAHPVLSRDAFYLDADISWRDATGRVPDWSDVHARQLACVIPEGPHQSMLLGFNAANEAAAFRIPAPPDGSRWRIAADTAFDRPFGEEGSERWLQGENHEAVARSSFILVSSVPAR